MRKLNVFLSGVVMLTMAMLPMAANAAIDLSADPETPELFATELTAASPTVTHILNAGNALDATAPLGFSIGINTSKYVRFDLNNGGTFGAALGNGSYTIAGSTVTLSSGGGIGSSYVIFEVAGTADIGPTIVGTLVCGTYDVVGTSTVTMTYGLYANPADAVNKTNALSNPSSEFIKFSSGMAVTKDAVVTQIIDVTQQSKQFTAALAGDLLHTRIGDVNVLVNTDVRKPTTGVKLVAGDIADFVGAGTKLEITGDFSGTGLVAGSVYIDNNGGCNNVDTAADTITSTTATFVLDAVEVADLAEVCFLANGSAAIVPITFNGLYTPTAGAIATVAPVSLPSLSTLSKNSQALQSPWFNTTVTGGISSRFSLTNMSGSDVDFNVTVYVEPGMTAILKSPYDVKGTVPANSVKVIEASQLVQITGGRTRASVVFEFLGSATTVQGVYQYFNLTTGLMSTVPLETKHQDQ